jgi:hypothetical protein
LNKRYFRVRRIKGISPDIKRKVIVITILETVSDSFCRERRTQIIKKDIKRLLSKIRSSSQTVMSIP